MLPIASPAQKKAQDALGAASAAFIRAGEYARHALGPFGARFSGLLGSYQQPVKYNLSVAREVLKQIYTAERLQPPSSLGAVLGSYSTLWSRTRSISYWREIIKSGEWARLGVYAVEAYGVFKVGEIVGRRSLVGYNVE
ncbi:mitochondrial ATP synthase g subunit-domain-containing protein [Multifurca ochricompacta]|uniref:Mitochondrial ATP synthase g subunit-domain-containing protein n=1 Tax=Multifurca ochricompacta TaxID=376703 RepID=A0AAD4QJW4_9AGAM|nr:mitochondrial ATP synthase g subunit-domain-containing protein [Multifurca ochricompacta]